QYFSTRASTSSALYSSIILSIFPFFFFNDTAPTEIYTLSLHDALPIYQAGVAAAAGNARRTGGRAAARGDSNSSGSGRVGVAPGDRKSTRLNSSHGSISYAVFCLKKKKKKKTNKKNKNYNTYEAHAGRE